MTTRQEHVTWCKQRALRELDYYLKEDPSNALSNAFGSISSDLQKHAETANHPAIMIGIMQLGSGLFKSADQMRTFINGFN